VLWCAPLPPAGAAKAIRGGVPICWPWFGPHASDASQPQHGLVRTADWSLVETRATGDGARISLGHAAWGCTLRLDVSIGRTLAMTLTTTNASGTSVSITEALHTYFRVKDVAGVTVTGLDGLTYRDNTDGGRAKVQVGPVQPAQETIALFADAPATAAIDDPGLRRRILIERRGGQATVVWHPGAAAANVKDIPPAMATGFVCVESATIAPHAVTLAPGASHALSVRYDVVAL
jgi:glucose-6-phosphate 1-epimerase